MKDEALEKGLHDILDFPGTIMTDSGTFQSHVYGEVDLDPIEIITFQEAIGSDISTILDRFTEPDDTREVAEQKVKDTIQRARQATSECEGSIALPIQGSIYPDLREKCAKVLGDLPGTLYPIGGVVPLLEDYRYDELVKVVMSSKKGLGPKGPVHLFGAGHPMIYPLAVLMGCDLFDSSSYIKYARRGDLMYPDGTRNISDLEYLACNCPVCRNTDIDGLKDESDEKRTMMLAEHNLWISYMEIGRVKQAIREHSLWELVEQRARGHPSLLDALNTIHGYWKFMEKFEPRGRRRALFYTGEFTFNRPLVKRILHWIEEDYSPPVKDAPSIVFNGKYLGKPYSRYLTKELEYLLPDYMVNLLVNTPFGLIPLELDGVYPIAQSLFPGYVSYGEIKDLVVWNGKETLESLEKGKGMSLDEMRVRSISDFQFCKGAGSILSDGKLEFVYNRKGGINNILLDERHILSVRAYDGLFSLKIPGATLLKDKLPPPILRIKVNDDSAEYNSQGKNVFAKFVLEAWEGIRPSDEVLIVDRNDDLVAVARAMLNKEEMNVFDKGMAARVRQGIER